MDVKELLKNLLEECRTEPLQPIEGLPIYTGFKCNSCVYYYSCSKKHANTHLKEQHAHQELTFQDIFIKVTIQRLSTAPHLKTWIHVKYDELNEVNENLDVAAAVNQVCKHMLCITI